MARSEKEQGRKIMVPPAREMGWFLFYDCTLDSETRSVVPKGLFLRIAAAQVDTSKRKAERRRKSKKELPKQKLSPK
ncbi:hypothetical protein A2609_02035 [Candidatus Kaiserbacteria bacterium RIFOXYD1_FULL_47_14]|uniref:Uncharacterized protein n=1 Tax=Candidatus Kaiserbacteria bacterium RIFOXYD1_FULL_47_14 TaxID=1798533 RepID=A0A1F6G4H6_9BACT|nr:MAG: hypothetical protein A2609_02035 [Candidatus Kaiserbacteria bacterium RIFOXYD1_FULL_47_14]